jgi:predicted glycosyltransferase
LQSISGFLGEINETPEFEGLQDLFKTVGIDRIVTLKQDYNEDLIRQFYATVWVAGDYSEMKWMSDTLQCSISKAIPEAPQHSL